MKKLRLAVLLFGLLAQTACAQDWTLRSKHFLFGMPKQTDGRHQLVEPGTGNIVPAISVLVREGFVVGQSTAHDQTFRSSSSSVYLTRPAPELRVCSRIVNRLSFPPLPVFGAIPSLSAEGSVTVSLEPPRYGGD